MKKLVIERNPVTNFWEVSIDGNTSLMKAKCLLKLARTMVKIFKSNPHYEKDEKWQKQLTPSK